MATKKQKREAALAKRDAFMAQHKADGLVAQQKAIEAREQQIHEIDAEIARRNVHASRALAIAILRQSQS